MAFNLKEQVIEWRAKAEESAHKRQEQSALKDASELQRLRAERIRLEGEGQRQIWKEKEISQIEKAKNEIAEAKRLRSERNKQKLAKTFAFVRKAIAPRQRPMGSAPQPPPMPKISIFNPPNVFSGSNVRDMGRIPQKASNGTPRVSLFHPQNIWTGKRV